MPQVQGRMWILPGTGPLSLKMYLNRIEAILFYSILNIDLKKTCRNSEAIVNNLCNLRSLTRRASSALWMAAHRVAYEKKNAYIYIYIFLSAAADKKATLGRA